MLFPARALPCLLLAPCSAAAGFGAAPATPEEKLAALGHVLPAAPAPVANYVPAVRTGNLVFLAGHIPRGADGKVIAGRVGADLTEAQAQDAARRSTLGLLASLKKEIGDLAKVKRIVRVTGYVRATEDFKNHPQVMNACSDLLVAVFGDKGRHARAALGMSSLPLGAAVEIDLVAEIE